MKSAAFRHLSPRSLDEAIALLGDQDGDEVKLIAGGQSLMPLMALRFSRPDALVDLNGIPGLAGVRATDDGGIAIGAMTRTRVLETDALVAERAPLAAAAAPFVAHRAIRNRGTVGGSVAHADPAAELPAVMVALEATIVAQGPAGRREIAAADFFAGYYSTVLRPDEILVELRIPAPAPRTGASFLEVSRRPGDFAMVAACATVTVDAAGACTAARIALTGVGSGPVVPDEAIAAIVGRRVDEASAKAAGDAAAVAIQPPSDVHASADYRRHLAGVLVGRILTRAAAAAA